MTMVVERPETSSAAAPKLTPSSPASESLKQTSSLTPDAPKNAIRKPSFEGGNFSYTDRTLETVVAIGGLFAASVLAGGVYLINHRLRKGC
jgi:hypothetical protein